MKKCKITTIQMEHINIFANLCENDSYTDEQIDDELTHIDNCFKFDSAKYKKLDYECIKLACKYDNDRILAKLINNYRLQIKSDIVDVVCEHGSIKCAKILLNKGEKITLQHIYSVLRGDHSYLFDFLNEYPHDGLKYAIQYGAEKCINIMLDKSMCDERLEVDSHGNSLLHTACEKLKEINETNESLINYGIFNQSHDINPYLNIIKKLYDSGYDMYTLNNDNEIPFDKCIDMLEDLRKIFKDDIQIVILINYLSMVSNYNHEVYENESNGTFKEKSHMRLEKQFSELNAKIDSLIVKTFGRIDSSDVIHPNKKWVTYGNIFANMEDKLNRLLSSDVKINSHSNNDDCTQENINKLDLQSNIVNQVQHNYDLDSDINKKLSRIENKLNDLICLNQNQNQNQNQCQEQSESQSSDDLTDEDLKMQDELIEPIKINQTNFIISKKLCWIKLICYSISLTMIIFNFNRIKKLF